MIRPMIEGVIEGDRAYDPRYDRPCDPDGDPRGDQGCTIGVADLPRGDRAPSQGAINRRVILYMLLLWALASVWVMSDVLLASPSSAMPTTPTATAAPVFVAVPATFPTGIYTDHMGSLVKVDALRITHYARDNHGAEWFDTDGRRYYRTPSGELFRVE